MNLNTLGMVHDFLRENIRPGAVCIDATAGRGRDTALLCSLTGENGRVYAFDIQQEAIAATKTLLSSQGLHAEVIQASHEHMASYVESPVDAIVFNFGRLPGGDPKIFTHGSSSIAAIEAGLGLLKCGGFMVLALYYGKENGYEERDAILKYLQTIDDRHFSVLCCSWLNRRHDPPMPVFIWKEK